MTRRLDATGPLLVGAVAYDPKVVTIWEGFKRLLAGRGLHLDFVLYSNYEAQVEALLAGQVHVAWNSPLAWIRSVRLAGARGEEVRALAMRDTDRDLHSILVVGEASPIERVEDLAGRAVAVGAMDSPQATLIPLAHLQAAGLEPHRDFTVVYQDHGGGKHGDHGAAERAGVRSLIAGDVDAACILGGNHIVFAAEGVVPAGSLRVIAETERFDHCNFTVPSAPPPHLVSRFRELLLSMRHDDPAVRPLFELEGLRAWVDGRTEGYGVLEDAVDRFGFYGPDGSIMVEGYRY